MTNEQTRQLIALLHALVRSTKTGRDLPPAVFDALLLLMPLLTLEVCILRHHGGAMEVWLTQRSERETRYPGIWHLPGSFLRNGEHFAAVRERLERQELGGSARLVGMKFLTVVNMANDRFGHAVSLAHRCRLLGRPRAGHWWPVRALPASVVAPHRHIIRLAAKVMPADQAKGGGLKSKILATGQA